MATSGENYWPPTGRTSWPLTAAVVNPPCTSKRWATVADLVAEQSAWADAHPDDPGSVPLHADEHEAWISWIRPASEIGTSRG